MSVSIRRKELSEDDVSKYPWPLRLGHFPISQDSRGLCVRARERDRELCDGQPLSSVSWVRVEMWRHIFRTKPRMQQASVLFIYLRGLRVERFVWHEMRGTGNIISPVTRSFQMWLGAWEGLFCLCWLQPEVFLFKILQVFFFNKFFFSLWAHPSFVSCFSMTFCVTKLWFENFCNRKRRVYEA